MGIRKFLTVDKELYVREGLEHASIYYAKLPKSRAACQVIIKFLEKHLITRSIANANQ